MRGLASFVLGLLVCATAALAQEQDAATPVDAHAATPVDAHAATPVDAHAATPVDAHAATPVDAHAATPVDAHAATPVDAHAAEGEAHGHDDEHGENYIPRIVNFAIFAGILVYFARKPIVAFFGDRRKGIEDSFTQAEAAQRDAAVKVKEMEQRLAALDGQVTEILSRAEAQAATEREAILETARLDAKKLLAQAEAQVADLEAASVRRLKAMAADLAVEAAREIIEKQLNAEDRNRLFDRTLKGLSKATSQ